MTNIAIIRGRLTKDPEVRTTGSGKKVCNFSIANDTGYKDADGNSKTIFMDVTVWGSLAEICEKHLSKGRMVLVTGALDVNNWEKDGVKHRSTYIRASEVEFLDYPKSDNAQSGNEGFQQGGFAQQPQGGFAQQNPQGGFAQQQGSFNQQPQQKSDNAQSGNEGFQQGGFAQQPQGGFAQQNPQGGFAQQQGSFNQQPQQSGFAQQQGSFNQQPQQNQQGGFNQQPQQNQRFQQNQPAVPAESAGWLWWLRRRESPVLISSKIGPAGECFHSPAFLLSKKADTPND